MRPHQNYNPNETQKNKNKLRVFLIFLILSTLFWLFIKLSEAYNADVEVLVEYTEIPSRKILQKEPADKIKLSMHATGYSLVKMRIWKRTVKYSLEDIQKLDKNRYFSKTSSNINFIQKQFPGDKKILDIKPDTLYFELSEKATKKVKVNPRIELQFATGYNKLGEPRIEPQKVSISGPQGILDTIDRVLTEKLLLKDITEDVQQEVKLVVPGTKVQVKPSKVQFSVKVGKFTEGEFEIPVRVINKPKGTIISIFPKNVKVTYVVPFSDFNKVTKEGFKVTVDYWEAKVNNLEYLIPKLVEKPSVVTAVRITPSNIDYLVKE